MQINLTGHHVDITDSLRDYSEQKVSRLERHFDHLTDIHIILTVEKLRHKAEATVNLSGGQVHAEAVESDMYAALDVMIDKLDRQVKKYKEKLTDHHARDTHKSRFA